MQPDSKAHFFGLFIHVKESHLIKLNKFVVSLSLSYLSKETLDNRTFVLN